MNVTYGALESAVNERLLSTGMPENVARVVTEHLLANERLGKASHGLFRLPGIIRAVDGKSMARDCVAVVADGHAMVLEAGGLPGIYALWCGVQLLVDHQTATDGLAAVAVRGYSGTTGSLGLHAWQAARAGLILLAVCNSESAISAPGGTNPVTGTNPIAFGFPSSDGAPVIGDYASSVWAYGDIAIAALRGESLPLGVVLDAQGKSSTDPADADAGSMLPSGGHRGFVQSVLVELLCGALAGGKVGTETSLGDAALLVGFAPSVFRPGASPEVQVQTFKQQIEASGQIAGQSGPHIPGARYVSLLQDPPTAIDVSDVVLARLRDAGIAI